MTTDVPSNWPDLAIALYERLTGKQAIINYEFLDMHIKVPSGTGPKAEHAEWVLSGTLRISTEEKGSRPN
jgi:hypothetical protein